MFVGSVSPHECARLVANSVLPATMSKRRIGQHPGWLMAASILISTSQATCSIVCSQHKKWLAAKLTARPHSTLKAVPGQNPPGVTNPARKKRFFFCVKTSLARRRAGKFWCKTVKHMQKWFKNCAVPCFTTATATYFHRMIPLHLFLKRRISSLPSLSFAGHEHWCTSTAQSCSGAGNRGFEMTIFCKRNFSQTVCVPIRKWRGSSSSTVEFHAVHLWSQETDDSCLAIPRSRRLCLHLDFSCCRQGVFVSVSVTTLPVCHWDALLWISRPRFVFAYMVAFFLKICCFEIASAPNHQLAWCPVLGCQFLPTRGK